MKPLRSVPFVFVGLVGLLLASACPGGLQSRVCVEYFELAEQCAAKAEPVQAEALRSVARLAREGFEKQNKPRVEESCAAMLKTLKADAACK